MKKFRGLGGLIFLAVFALAAVVVMLLWNSVAVYLFSVPEVNFWYAAGLLLLSKLLLGGFKHGWPHHHHGHHRHFHRRGKGTPGGMEECRDADTIREMHERFHAMSGKDRREYIRKHMASVFGEEEGYCHARPASENGPEEGIDGNNSRQ